MNTILATGWTRVRDSYWFVPSIMAVGAILLSFVTTALDNSLGSQWLDEISVLFVNKPAGARAVLSTVAGSMITVAGVTFSMTILSISYTTSQIGPRLMGNFMRDTGNQVTLGVFISTFLYCLMVLRTVRNAETARGGDGSTEEIIAAFVPHIAILVGVLLAIASVGVLIYFIHHVPESIHISNVIGSVGRDLNDRIEKQFPSRMGEGIDKDSVQQETPRLPHSFFDNSIPLLATDDGYIEYLDGERLMKICRENDLVVRLRFRPGDFVCSGDILLLADGPKELDDDLADELQTLFVKGNQQTVKQNLRFVINQLVDVSLRGLSPGVNDPFTAMNCMDWLQTGLLNLAERELPDAYRFDEDGKLRVVAQPETFISFANLVFDQLRPYVAVDRNAALHMMEMLVKITIRVEDPTDRRALVRHGTALRKECRSKLDDLRGVKEVSKRYRTMIRLLHDDHFRRHALATGDWLGGRA